MIEIDNQALVNGLTLQRKTGETLSRQIYSRIRSMILTGQLGPGMRLPSSRDLATGLNLSRWTVQNAFEQLLAEGYLEGRVGSGTYVTGPLPSVAAGHQNASGRDLIAKKRGISRLGAEFLGTEAKLLGRKRIGLSNAFRTGISALDKFPTVIWGRLMAKRWREGGDSLLGYLDPAGYRPLRDAIAGYLGAARGIRCLPEQVVIVAGSQQALDLAARVLVDPGDRVWLEDPGYLGARGALTAAGARLVPVPVDEEGLNVTAGIRLASKARLAYVSPSHQFPTGATLSLSRRLALLEWAIHRDAWILEDDYDSEYRFRGRPLAALQELDSDGRVIYIGTFSKTLFPALRLGYIVPPIDLVDAFVAARHISDRHSSGLEQATLTDFIVQGHFARHIRRMRRLYESRQKILLDAARGELADHLTLKPADTGMHLVGWLRDSLDDQSAAQRAAAYQIEVTPLSWYSLRETHPGALLLGYGAVPEDEIAVGVRRLAEALAH